MRRISQLISSGLVALALVATAAGCGSSKPGPGAGPSSAAATAYPVTVGSVTLAKRPERIISLAPTLTEMLFAIGAGAQVVAVDDNSNFPAQIPKSDLSGYKPNAEAIAKYLPDLVVISNDSGGITKQLAALKITVFLSPAAVTLDDTYQEIRDLGTLTGHSADATTLATQMRNDVAKLVKDLPTRAKPLTYYFELDQNLFSVTSKTFVGSVFAAAGLVNIADPSDKASTGYPQLSAEIIIKANPDLIFLADTKCCGQSLDLVAKRPGWANLAAVKNGRVVVLDDDVASRWGPRIVDLLRAVVAAAAAAPVS